MDAGEIMAVAKFQQRTFEEDLNLKISLKHNTYTRTHTGAAGAGGRRALRQKAEACTLPAECSRGKLKNKMKHMHSREKKKHCILGRRAFKALAQYVKLLKFSLTYKI